MSFSVGLGNGAQADWFCDLIWILELNHQIILPSLHYWHWRNIFAQPLSLASTYLIPREWFTWTSRRMTPPSSTSNHDPRSPRSRASYSSGSYYWTQTWTGKFLYSRDSFARLNLFYRVAGFPHQFLILPKIHMACRHQPISSCNINGHVRSVFSWTFDHELE